jgi:23S rRNA (uracil1939-C5)-methyltransferase
MAQNIFSKHKAKKRQALAKGSANSRKAKPSRNTKNTADSIECEIVRLSHEGRGVAIRNGKTQFIEGALPGETVKARFSFQRSKYDELKVEEVINASPLRVSPPCPYFGQCGGCSLQHLNRSAQIEHKASVLKEQLQHFGNISADAWMEPITMDEVAYRSKARLGVYYDESSCKVLIGFREKGGKHIIDINQCTVLDSRISCIIPDFKVLIGGLSLPKSITQLDVAASQDELAVTFRHVKPLPEHDISALLTFAKLHDIAIYLKPGQANSVHKIWPEDGVDRLSYSLALSTGQTLSNDQTLRLSFHPNDFTQVNMGLNQEMVLSALSCLDLQPEDRVLDLFCGLGNFTLPIACYAKSVVGVEGNDEMVSRGRENAKLNALDNVSFYAGNLQTDIASHHWAKESFDKVLIDPPRSGALDVVKVLGRFNAKRIVYISCNPATLARDSGVLVDQGYRLKQAGVLDMFPHTSHVESIALFEKLEK